MDPFTTYVAAIVIAVVVGLCALLAASDQGDEPPTLPESSPDL